ncbi:MAG: YbhB/YbcL family Raf kinase inhibitor-like protein [Haloarculaceae archaeon]
MIPRRRVLAAAVAAPLAGCSDGNTVTVGSPGGLTVTSPAFETGGTIPTEYTGDGADRSPPLSIGGVPAEAVTLALVVDDPDAPSGTFVHWLLWNVPGDRADIPAGVPQRETVADLGGARQGTNGFDELGYRGPLPPSGDGPHTYRFTVYALDTDLNVEAGARRDHLEEALAGPILASGRLSGEYER